MYFPLSFCKNAPPPTFSMVHLLHRLYGVDAPVVDSSNSQQAGSKGQGTGTQGHHFELPSYLWNECSYRIQICAQMHYGQLLPADQKLCQNVAGVT